MPVCTLCGEDVEKVTECKECNARFCAFCGDHDDKICDFCFDEDSIDYDEDVEYDDEDWNQ